MNARILLLIAAAAIPTTLAAQPSGSGSAISGIWLNPKGSVAVRIAPCAGNSVCGRVVWANPEALQDAREGGVSNLIGTELLENYQPSSNGTWAGTVYVPDMGSRFSSTITQVDPNNLRIRGCLIGGLFCKSQIWRRTTQVADR